MLIQRCGATPSNVKDSESAIGECVADARCKHSLIHVTPSNLLGDHHRHSRRARSRACVDTTIGACRKQPRVAPMILLTGEGIASSSHLESKMGYALVSDLVTLDRVPKRVQSAAP